MRSTYTLLLASLLVVAAVSEGTTLNYVSAQPATSPTNYGNSYNNENKNNYHSNTNRTYQGDEYIETIFGTVDAFVLIVGTLVIAAAFLLFFKCMKHRSQKN